MTQTLTSGKTPQVRPRDARQESLQHMQNQNQDMGSPSINETEFGHGKTGILSLPIIPDRRGSLTFIEGNRHIPFDVRRVYYLYDVPNGAARGGHAHKELHQLLIAISGSFDVHVDNGREKQTYTLNRPHVGLYIGPMVWRELDNFSSNSICLVLASRLYEEGDYYREYEDFRRAYEAQRTP